MAADNADAQLADWIARAQRLRTLNVDAAKEAAPAVEKAIRTTAAAGQTAEGVAWKPRKDGGRPLANAAQHVTAAASGTTITASVPAPYNFHQTGNGHVPQRAILPTAATSGIPARISTAVREAARRVFGRIAGGA